MPSPLDPYQNLVHDLVATYGQSVTMDLYRPAYDQDGSESLISSGLAIRLDPSTAGSQLQHKLPGVNYFVVAGPKELIKPGDVLKPNPEDGCTPMVTVLQNTGMGNITAMRSNLIGEIIDTTRIAAPVYSNIYYDFTGAAGYTTPILSDFEGSKIGEYNRVVIWTRDAVLQGMRFKTGFKRNLIVQVVSAGNHMLLYTKEDEI